MATFDTIKLKKSETKKWAVCPPYQGIAAIVGVTEPKTYKTPYGDKEKFRLLVELNLKNEETGKNWVVTSLPFSPSLYEMSALFKFCKSIGLDAASKEFSMEQLAGKYINVIVENTEPTIEGDVYANITYSGKPTGATFTTTYTEKETTK